ncbi:MAG: TonB family protein [Bacteriovoracaceae bacterium]
MLNAHLEQDIKKSFLISFGVHALLIIFAVLTTKFLLGPSSKRSLEIEIIQSSVRVDVVGMPKFTAQELREMQKNAAPAEPESVPEEAAPAVAESPKEEIKEDVIKEGDLVIEEQKKQNDFQNLLSNYSSKKVKRKEAKPQPKKAANTVVSGQGSKIIDGLILEGNKVSAGSALVGDITSETSSEFSAYVQGMPERVRVNWRLPSYLMDRDLKCRIKVFLNNNGQLIKTEIVESSGVEEFDTRALNAIKEASFPPPSKEVGIRLSTYGIILGFPL